MSSKLVDWTTAVMPTIVYLSGVGGVGVEKGHELTIEIMPCHLGTIKPNGGCAMAAEDLK